MHKLGLMQTSPYSARAAGCLALALAACGDPDPATTESSTGAQGTTEAPTGTTGTTDIPTTAAPTDTGTSGTTDLPTTEPGTTTTDSTGELTATDGTTEAGSTGEVCGAALCGDPPVCCLDTEKCMLGACVPACGSSGGLEFLDTEIEWSWTVDEVIVMPLVADITGDATPEIVINTYRADKVTREFGEIVVLDGKTGAELWRIAHDPENGEFGSLALGTPVLADVSGDQKPDIIYPGRGVGPGSSSLSRVHAVDGAGKLLWTGHTADNMPVSIRWDRAAAVATNFDDDPEAEIVIGGAIFDHDGLLVWDQDGKSGTLGTPTDNKMPPKLLYSGGLATVADLTGDGKPELITGREAWTVEWTPGAPPTVSLTQLWQNLDGVGNDGWPAVADLDKNGTPEVVLVAWPDIKVIDGATGKLWCGVDPSGVMCEGDDSLRTQPIPIKGSNLGGPATIADFDGDGRPEASIAGGVAYAVYDFNRTGEMIVKPDADPLPAAGAMYVRWFKPTQDNSSAATGSSVFDFQGDGAAEVAYQDECRVFVFDGRNGDAKLAINNSSGTVHEYPLVVDADGDEHAEFLVVANLSEPTPNTNCARKYPGYMPRKGVYMYRPMNGEWVPTRKVWTQHAYHVTNVDDAGNPPLMEQDNWTTPGLNNFRQNLQGECK